ncbi:MAG: flagellar basal body L-ring protein FlgH [bacterium]|nr:flagellar basal body L-ring protein FlgH [Planctomycetota bacterium]HIL52456.1 flagellar basal body L-ring protein FlgH [Planctomycetota bacterium]
MKTPQLCLCMAALTLLSSMAQAQLRRGAIYDASRGPYGLIANKTASRPGDLVTVLISETQDVKDEEKTDFKRQTDLNYQLNSFDIKPNTFNVLPSLGASSQDDFKGEAKQEKKGAFTARLTAVVVDALPNGNLVIRGRREIRVDKQVKTIEFSGLVRRYDIKQNNTVESELVANAKVSYTGSGPATEATNRSGLGGMLHSALVWLWPF